MGFQLQEREVRSGRVVFDVSRREVGSGVRERHPRDRRSGLASDLDDPVVVGIGHDRAFGRHERDDLAEGFEDGGEIRIEVRVIELDVADEEVRGS